MEEEKVFVKNRYGVNIVKCCASCQHCKLDNRARICTKGEGAVPSSYFCEDWKMKNAYEKAGKGDGRVKKGEYLQYALERKSKDDAAAFIAAEKKLAYTRLSLNEIRQDYMKKNGKIYL